ncbi:hypothetical protein TL16_g08811 [Triparma laevis f. inornata]|uniref:EF-hand domain-containing protein n=1 Tax=Triparma laevis f. inornata TaxID=1714386 RepID=A0A9W7AZN9_9STRA|nr:hypothetical protein TL16_g08811 [Triparma laevis f. inornata]
MAEFLVLFGLDRTPFTTRAFRLIDNDRSGELDFFEFIAAVWNYCTMDWETLVRYSFDLFDTDNSGQLEMEEIERLVCYVAGTKKPDSRAKKVLKLMDHPTKPTFRVQANEKQKKKHTLKAKDGLILKTYDVDDDFESSGNKKKVEKKKSKKRKQKHSDIENDENASSNSSSNSTNSTQPTVSTYTYTSVTTEYIDFKIGSNKTEKKKKKSKPPTSVDIRKQQRDMATKEIDKRQREIDAKFKRKNPKAQSFAQKNLGLLSTNFDKENSEVNSPPPLPMEDQIRPGRRPVASQTWAKLGRKPLQPRRPRPLDTPPNKKNKKNRMSKSPSLKKSFSAMFSPEGKLGKSVRAATDFISSPFSAKKAKKRMKKNVQFDSDIATTIVFSETPTKLTISEFR